MRSKYFSLLILLICSIDVTTAQQQAHIPWPSLADSPWPVLRGDMQGTGRSKYIGPRSADYIIRRDMPLGITFGPVIGYGDILFTGTAAFNTNPFNFFYSLEDKLDIRWEFKTLTAWPNNSGPTLAFDSTIYFGSANGNTYALDYAGNLKWERDDIGLRGHPFISISKNGTLYLPLENRLVLLDKNGNTLKDTIFQKFNPHPFLFSIGGDTVYYINERDELRG
ncbi:MAG: PQQ-binding-like beta-propeller repeat protein, partial [Ignavibacteriaceae bacterium]